MAVVEVADQAEISAAASSAVIVETQHCAQKQNKGHTMTHRLRPEDEVSFLRTLLADDDDNNDDDKKAQVVASEHLTNERAALSYLEHLVLPEDTFHGICLRYHISTTELRRANCFSGSNLALAPTKLRIPVGHQQQQEDAEVTPQDTNTTAYKVQSLLIQFPAFQESEART